MRKKYIIYLWLVLLVSAHSLNAQSSKWEAYWNEIQQLPIDSVKELRLDGMRLGQFPKQLLAFNCVERISLDDNLFARIPRELEQFPHLKKLSIRRNFIQGTHINISKLKSLEVFDAGNNKLDTTLTVRTNRKLNRLILSNIRIKQLKLKGRLPKEVDLSYASLERIDWMPFRRARVEVLVLHSNRLNALPKGVSRLRRLRKLVLGNNQFEEIPAEMAKMKRLESLMFYKNRLTSLPDFVWELKNLTEVDVHHNRLATLPNEIGVLSNLKELYLANNCLQSLPDSIGKLANLRYLYVENNKLETLPATFNQLIDLERMSLLGNRFIVYPQVLTKMPWLHELDISENDIEAFPIEFSNWQSLKLLLLHDNACKNGMSCMLSLERLEQSLNNNDLRIVY